MIKRLSTHPSYINQPRLESMLQPVKTQFKSPFDFGRTRCEPFKIIKISNPEKIAEIVI